MLLTGKSLRGLTICSGLSQKMTVGPRVDITRPKVEITRPEVYLFYDVIREVP